MEKLNYYLGMVKNDLHDIGKNIVKIMFEIVGFRVVDLGVNVPPEDFAPDGVSAAEKALELMGFRSAVEILPKN